jgi:hypothetical protein
VQAVQSDRVGEEVGDGKMGSRTTTETPPMALSMKAGSPKDGVGDGDSDGAASREVASMAQRRGRRRQRRGRSRSWH